MDYVYGVGMVLVDVMVVVVIDHVDVVVDELLNYGINIIVDALVV